MARVLLKIIMRTRVTLSPQIGNLESTEYKWNKATIPWSLQEPLTLSSKDSDPLIRNLFWGFGFNIADYPILRDEITDEVGVDGRFRPCLHTREQNFFWSPHVRFRADECCWTNAYVRGLHASYIAGADAICTPPSHTTEWWQQSADKAAAVMWPRINKDTSLVNFVLELKDLKRANPLPSIRRIFKRHKHLRDLADPKLRKEFTKELTNRLTSAHLNAEFGIKPFVKDVVQMYDELRTLSARVQSLRTNSSRRLVSHYRRPLEGDGQTGDLVFTSVDAPNFVGWLPSSVNFDSTTFGGSRPRIFPTFHCRWKRPPVYHATMRYSYTVPSMGKAEEDIATHMDALGLRLDPAIIWNAIPFSFLVDWVVDVSGFLRSFARDNFPIEVSVTDFCHSVTWSKEALVSVAFLDDRFDSVGPGTYGSPVTAMSSRYPVSGIFDFAVYKGTKSYYNRMLGVPNIHAVTTGGLNLRKAALAGSLLLQRKRQWNSTRYQYRARGE